MAIAANIIGQGERNVETDGPEWLRLSDDFLPDSGPRTWIPSHVHYAFGNVAVTELGGNTVPDRFK